MRLGRRCARPVESQDRTRLPGRLDHEGFQCAGELLLGRQTADGRLNARDKDGDDVRSQAYGQTVIGPQGTDDPGVEGE